MVYDKTGNILIFNSQLERISGYRKEEIPDVQTAERKVFADQEEFTYLQPLLHPEPSIQLSAFIYKSSFTDLA